MPQDLYHYETMIDRALRGVVREALERASREGLRGAHHFYIGFATDMTGVSIPESLRARYPQEMTIVLQHQFWDLKADEAGFSVGLSFGGVPTTLVIPLAAVTGFADPAVRFGLRFRPQGVPEIAAEEAGAASGEAPAPAEPAPPGAEADKDKPAEPQVVSLDAFRRRSPPKD